MEINIYEDGQVIHLETCSNDCSVATVHNDKVIENKVSGNALNNYITAFLNSVVNRWMYNFMEGNRMDILFRKDRKTNEVVAFIPESTVNYGHILSYMHIGQHSEASLQYYWETVKATEEEYKPLLKELKSIYADEALVIKKRLNMDKLRSIWR